MGLTLTVVLASSRLVGVFVLKPLLEVFLVEFYLVRRKHVGLLLAIFTHSYGGLELQIFLLENTTLFFAIHGRRYACVVRLRCMNLMGLCTIKYAHVAMSEALVQLWAAGRNPKEIVVCLWALK